MRTSIKIQTIGELQMGETFEFVYRQEEFQVGDIVQIKTHHGSMYGWATVTKVIEKNYYQAERSE